MTIFNSYVKLPEGIDNLFILHLAHLMGAPLTPGAFGQALGGSSNRRADENPCLGNMGVDLPFGNSLHSY